jgi:hypothetical protein
MNEIPEVKAEDIKNFIRLISWGARSYSSKLKHEFDYEYFYSEGLKSLDKCMRFFRAKLIANPECLYSYRKAKNLDIRFAKNLDTIKKLDNRLGKNVSHPILSSLAFSKYFKAALFRRFSNIRRMSFAAKRIGNEVSLEDWQGITSENSNGFAYIEYKELIDDISTKIDNEAERMIFLMKANPPEDLWYKALQDNRRKLKVGVTRRLRTGKKNNWGGKIAISDKNIRDFLNTRGICLSPTEYNLAFENVKNKVIELIKK